MTGESFNFWNGKSASDLDAFVQILSEMSYEEFASYVNESKNDFANWIEGSLENQELAGKVRPLLEKDLVRAVIVDYLSKQTNHLVIGGKKDLQDDALVKEIMKKNEEFFKDAERKDDTKHDENVLVHEPEFNSANEKQDDFSLRRDNIVAEAPHKAENSKGHKGFNKDMLAGLLFGIIMGALLTVIVQQIIVNW